MCQAVGEGFGDLTMHACYHGSAASVGQLAISSGGMVAEQQEMVCGAFLCSGQVYE